MQQHPPPSGNLPGQYPQWQSQPGYQSPQPPPLPGSPLAELRKHPQAPLVAIVAVAFIIGIAMGYGVGYSAGGASVSHSGATTTTQSTQAAPTSDTSTPTDTPIPPTPTHAPTWTITQTFKGNGNSKTGTFAVPDDWKILWACDAASFGGNSFNLIVDVTGSDNTLVDPGTINTICATGNVAGATEEHQAGTVYLDVQSEGAWTITIQELK